MIERDPFVYEEDGRVYLFYSVAGEQGIGLAEVVGEWHGLTAGSKSAPAEL